MPLASNAAVLGSAEIVMLPVEAGDATLILWTDGPVKHSVLIDTGLNRDEVISYLHAIGVFHLDLIILSHPDMDHLGGLFSLVNSRAMSIDRIWCFDLGILRTYVKTGVIPEPQEGTREIVYFDQLRGTLDEFDRILLQSSGRSIQVLQVSEGYRLALGGMLFEVLHPPQHFYDSLRHPSQLKKLLKRKIPELWRRSPCDTDEKAQLAMPLSSHESRESAAHSDDEHLRSREVLLTDITDPHELASGEPEQGHGDEKLTVNMIGSLYNNMSIVVKVSVLSGISGPSMLLSGDLSDWTSLILRQYQHLQSDILKLPHHGSKNVTADFEFIREQLWPMEHLEFLALGWPVSLWRFATAMAGNKAPNWLSMLVKPQFVLVFPYSRYRLPSMDLGGFSGKVVSNRRNQDIRRLADRANPAAECRLFAGSERNQIGMFAGPGRRPAIT